MTPWSWLQLVLAYLLGSIPFAYLAGLARGIDIRKHGSGNLGATNVFRVMGKGPGVAVLLADTAKGALAVLALPHVAPSDGFSAFKEVVLGASAHHTAWWPCLLGLAAVLGHTYTVFLGFKGGKGVATSLGVFLGLAPLATLGVLAVFGLVFWLSRMVSAGSLAAAAALPPLVAAFGEWRPASAAPAGPFGEEGRGFAERPVLWLAVGLAVLVWVKHLPNIRRILAGTENRFGGNKGAH